jgi:hypothetical protein
MRLQTTQSFNKIYVIDSLLDTELQTGADLFNHNIRWATEQIEGLDSDYERMETKNELIEFLKGVRADVLYSKIGPIIHVEAHGDENGLRLRSREELKWEELIEHLCAINHGCGNNLLLTLAVCKGAHLTKIIKQTITGRAPFWALIGPAKEVTAGQVAKAFSEFYTEFLASFDGSEALKKLNNSFPQDAPKYSFVYCETLFREAFKGYLDTYCSGKTKKSRLEGLLTEIRKTKAGRLLPIGILRRDLKQRLRKENQRPHFERFKRRFFMIDDFPQNSQRFRVEFEEFL